MNLARLLLRLGLCLLLGVLCIAPPPPPSPSLAQPGTGGNSVAQLSLGDFHAAVVASDAPLLLVFHAPWCHHCRQLSPILEQTSHTTPKEELRVAKIDATQERALATRFSIKSYPALFFLIEGKVYPYGQRRTAQAFLHFAREGHKHAASLSFLASPFGPIGRLRGLVSGLGQTLVEWSAWVEQHYAVPKELGIGLALLATASAFVGIFVFSIWLSMEWEKRKRD